MHKVSGAYTLSYCRIIVTNRFHDLGMTDMTAPILYVIRDEALAYACFCALMRYMSPLFDANGIAVNRRLDLLRKTIQAIDIELWKKIEQCDIGLS